MLRSILPQRKRFLNPNTKLADQNIYDAMVHQRALSPEQRSAKIQRDRQRRRHHNAEFERLRSVEAKYEVIIASLLEKLKVQFMAVRDVSSQLTDGSKRLNEVELCLASTMSEVDNIIHHHQNETEEAEMTRQLSLSEWQFQAQAQPMLLSPVVQEASSEPIDLLSSVGKEANNEPIVFLPWVGKELNGSEPIDINHGIDIETTCHNDIETEYSSSDEFVQDFIKKLEEWGKSRVDFPDFKGLKEEMEKSGRFSFPPSLLPIDEMVKKEYGDITADSNQSTPLIRDSYILFCSVIKEMNELQLEQIDLNKLILWRDAINSGLSIGFKGNFAIEQLKKIARAWFASKAAGNDEREVKRMEEKISELKAQLHALEKKRDLIVEKQSSKIYRDCVCDQQYFQGKPLTTGLFLS